MTNVNNMTNIYKLINVNNATNIKNMTNIHEMKNINSMKNVNDMINRNNIVAYCHSFTCVIYTEFFKMGCRLVILQCIICSVLNFVVVFVVITLIIHTRCNKQ